MSPLGSVSGRVCQSLGFTTPEVRGGLRRAARDDPEPAGHGLLREGWREARREQGHRHRTVGRRHPAQGDDRGARDRLSRVGFRGRGGRGREPSSHRPRSRSTTPIVPATAASAVTPSSRTRPCTPREKPFARTRLPEDARARSTDAGARRLQTGRRTRKDVPPDRIREIPRECPQELRSG